MDFLNVHDFGAAGDGSNDDTAAILKARDSLPLEGGVIFFPTGTYIIKDYPQGIPIGGTKGLSHVTYRGDGMWQTALQAKRERTHAEREARSPASTPPQERSVVAKHGAGKSVKQTTPPKHAAALAPDSRRGRPLRLRASRVLCSGGAPWRYSPSVRDENDFLPNSPKTSMQAKWSRLCPVCRVTVDRRPQCADREREKLL